MPGVAGIDDVSRHRAVCRGRVVQVVPRHLVRELQGERIPGRRMELHQPLDAGPVVPVMSPSTDGLSRSMAARANRGYAKRSRSHDPSARRHRRMVASASRPRRAAHALPRKRTRALNASRHSRSECNSKRGARHARPGGMNSRWSGLSVSICRLRSIALSRSGGMENPVACSRRSTASHHRPLSCDSSQPPVGSHRGRDRATGAASGRPAPSRVRDSRVRRQDRPSGAWIRQRHQPSVVRLQVRAMHHGSLEPALRRRESQQLGVGADGDAERIRPPASRDNSGSLPPDPRRGRDRSPGRPPRARSPPERSRPVAGAVTVSTRRSRERSTAGASVASGRSAVTNQVPAAKSPTRLLWTTCSVALRRSSGSGCDQARIQGRDEQVVPRALTRAGAHPPGSAIDQLGT